MSQQFSTLTDLITLQFGEEVQLTGEIVYDHHHSMLYLNTSEDSEVLNINLDQNGLHTPEGHAWIKDWSEHSGVTDQLVKSQLVKHIKTAQVGPFDSDAHLVEVIG